VAEDDRGQRLEEIAGRILDGGPIDWNDLQSGASDHGLMRQFRLLSAVATVHRSVTAALPTNEPSRTGEPMPLPATWGALEVREHVGRGSFGDVYRAWDPRLARDVALKLVREHGSASLASPVVEEGSLLARVRHPNVLTVYGAERIEGRVGIWTEYIRGETLADEVARRSRSRKPPASAWTSAARLPRSTRPASCTVT
jgi:serine/threonine protein kinase